VDDCSQDGTHYKAFRASLIKSIQIGEDRFGVKSEIVASLPAHPYGLLRCAAKKSFENTVYV
jgi:hypothetical protein